jgi:hypothetical protein
MLLLAWGAAATAVATGVPLDPPNVTPGGALLLVGRELVVSSTFSEGAHLHAFNLTASDGWHVSVTRHAGCSVVSVVGKAPSFTVERTYAPVGQGHVLINDTITAIGGVATKVVGVQVRHRVWSTSPATLPITGVSGPNTLSVKDCATNGITGELRHVAHYGSTVGLDAGTGGNPTVYGLFGSGTTASVGVGMVALDDVFVAHSETANRAGQVDAFTGTRACQALRSTPPSIELADPHFGLPSGEAHTLEWAVITVQQPGSDATDDVAPSGYWAFINQVRQHSGVSGRVTIPKLGPMGAFQAGLLRTDGYSALDWTKWSVADTRSIVRRNGIGHVISQMPRVQFISPCGLSPTVAHGSGFVNENTSRWDAYFKALVAKVKAAEGDSVRVLIYFHAFISGERGASAKYPDDRILNYEGQQLNYSHCEAMPLFYPMIFSNGSTNKYGQQLYRYLDKAKSLGADGICE